MHTETVAFASYNCGSGADFRKVRDLTKLARAVDVIGGQEFGDRPKAVRLFLKRNPGWKVLWVPKDNPGRKTPIFYNADRLSLRWWSQVLAVRPGIWLGPRGAGPDRSERKHVNTARFRVKGTKVRFRFLNTHATPSAFRPNFGTEGARRKAVWRTQTNKFFHMASRAKVPVVGVGDFNAEAGNDTMLAIRPSAWKWLPTPPTHGNRRIDLIGYMLDPRIKPVAVGKIPTSSDHDAPWATFKVSTRR